MKMLNCEESKVRCWIDVRDNLKGVLGNSVIKEFLEDEANHDLFNQMLEKPEENQLKILDSKFKNFYRYNRIIRYLSGLIRRYPIDYDKRVKLRNKRYPLIVDKTITNQGEKETGMIDLIKDKNQREIDHNLVKQDGFFSIESSELDLVLKELNDKQRHILHLYYEIGLNNKEIGGVFGQTEQNISYWHKKTLKYLAARICEIKNETKNQNRE